jgi:alpha,alpha-trehalase
MNKPATRLCLVLLLATAAFAGLAEDLNTQSPGREAEADANAKILAYIDGGWDTLSRSMTDCRSLVDPKVTTAPVLYLPAGMDTPSGVAAVERQCNVEVRQLPRKITHMGEVGVSEFL